MDWRQHIHSDPEVLIGKPVIRGTRLSVDFILNLLTYGAERIRRSMVHPRPFGKEQWGMPPAPPPFLPAGVP